MLLDILCVMLLLHTDLHPSTDDWLPQGP